MTPPDLLRHDFDVECALLCFAPDRDVSLPDKLAALAPHFSGLLTTRDKETGHRSFLGEESISSYFIKFGDDKLRPVQGARIILGGGGVILPVCDHETGRRFAVKVPRVSMLIYGDNGDRLSHEEAKKKADSETNLFLNEIRVNALLSHQNIVRSFIRGKFSMMWEPRSQMRIEVPYLILEWVEDQQVLEKYVETAPVDFARVVDLIVDSFSAIDCLHSAGYVHWDIKNSNVWFDKGGVLRLLDFGNCQRIGSEEKVVYTTKGNFPPVFAPHNDNQDVDANRYPVVIPSAVCHHPAVDLWMLGRCWDAVFDFTGSADTAAERRRDKVFPPDDSRSQFAFSCLSLIFRRLLLPLTTPAPDTEALFSDANLYYRNATEVLDELRRVSLAFGAGQNVAELLVNLDEIVRLPVTGNSAFTSRVSRLFNHNVLVATKKHHQLGLIHLVYPGATHARSEHLLGALATTCLYVRSLYLNPGNAFWKVTMSREDIDALLLASLLHDAGHLAFGHFLEELTPVFATRKHEDMILSFLDACKRFLKAGDYPPQSFRFDLFEFDCKVVQAFCHLIEADWAPSGNRESLIAFIGKVCAILRPDFSDADLGPMPLRFNMFNRRQSEITKYYAMHSIIDSPIDSDKLDYLRRDSHHCGVSYGLGIDLDRFLQSLCVCIPHGVEAASPGIGVSLKGLAPYETIVTARYHMFASVYWHHTARMLTAALQRALVELLTFAKDEDACELILSQILTDFREHDDQACIENLRNRLSKAVQQKPLSPKPERRYQLQDIVDLTNILTGQRTEFFKLCYELSARFTPSVTHKTDVPGAKPLGPSQIIQKIYVHLHKGKQEPLFPRPDEQIRWAHDVVALSERLGDRFEQSVNTHSRKPWRRTGMVLLDIPERNKDQVRGVFVSLQNKRTSGEGLAGLGLAVNDLAKVEDVSPLVESLQGALDSAVRSFRVFMDPEDTKALFKDAGVPKDRVWKIWDEVIRAEFAG